MSFILSKLAWGLLQPANFLMLLLILAVLLLLLGRRRAGTILAGGVAAILLVLALTPVSDLLLGVLEERFPLPRPMPERVDGIIVLGGAVDAAGTRYYGIPQLNSYAERMTVLPGLMARYPQARIVFTGGSGRLLNQTDREVDVARQLWGDMGLDLSRITFEGNSRNTWENALYSKDLMQPAPGEVWLLVTSAFHMPRSVGIFRKAGWPVIAYPADFMHAPPDDRWRGLNLLVGLGKLTLTLRETVGLISYRAMDRTDALFPAPDAVPEAGSAR
ncbi:YdcF family protein [Oleisolibacter albus]|uniref:YdcF family protein n=1 Tax=Oleisolibacter albus TaxID=2171757 RepID=UPI000DF487BB|nr:YdcF family protein [Oleisolibacter albus]